MSPTCTSPSYSAAYPTAGASLGELRRDVPVFDGWIWMDATAAEFTLPPERLIESGNKSPCDDIVKAAMAPAIEAEEKCYNSAKALNPDWDQSNLDEACRQFEAYYLPPPFWPGSILRDSTTAGIDAFASAAVVVLAP